MSSRIVMTVVSRRMETVLSPLFRFAPWVMVAIDGESDQTFLENTARTDDELVDLICRQMPEMLIAGHVSSWGASRLIDAGIDVRIGPCSVPAKTLMPIAKRLPTTPQVMDLGTRRLIN